MILILLLLNFSIEWFAYYVQLMHVLMVSIPNTVDVKEEWNIEGIQFLFAFFMKIFMLLLLLSRLSRVQLFATP